MKDKYFLLNGRSYPDTVTPGSLQTMSTDAGITSLSRCLRSSTFHRQKALLRISDLTLRNIRAGLVASDESYRINAKLLRDQAGNNLPTTPTRSRWPWRVP